MHELFDEYGLVGLKKDLKKNTEEAKRAHKKLYYTFDEFDADRAAIEIYM